MADLKKILGEELYNQVTEKLGENKIDVVSDGSYIPKNKFDEINTQNETYKTQVGTLNGQLKDFEKAAKGNEDLLAQIETMKTDNEALNGKIKDITLDSAIKLGLVNNNAKYADLLTGKIDKSKLQLGDNGSVIGLDEQIKGLQEGYKDLFQSTVNPSPGANPAGGGDPVKTDFRNASKEDYQKEMGKYGIHRFF
ncbi:phage scaffolding protein [Clostridium pasteurianum]|uniref:Phage minor structural protein GP20 n=1 Tax=Clostridium pasteurianum BC1 TaxID=86416 RepID=R4K6J5_CLOPA|nr:phage scaffolding protein [Clostridium pasteurianum]AGK98173.1 Phage minor structural protein GP20 [Clostridium pasteurianum BC1]